jgi:hypothetical protein
MHEIHVRSKNRMSNSDDKTIDKKESLKFEEEKHSFQVKNVGKCQKYLRVFQLFIKICCIYVFVIIAFSIAFA